MLWKEVSLGHFQRPLGENERFIKAIGDRAHSVGLEHWSITAYATFTMQTVAADLSDAIVHRLKQAWKALRFEHPSFASTAGEDNINYIVPTASDLEYWANETFIVIDDDEKSLSDVIASLRPSPYVTGYYLPHTSQFIIHLSHWRNDGFGVLQLLDSFFGLCLKADIGDLPWGSEVARLVPTVEEALNNPIESTPEIHAAAQRYLSTVAHTKNSVGVAQTKDISTPPSGTRSVHLRFSTETTGRISQACQNRGISVLSAVHASIAAATYQFASPESREKPYTSTIRFTLRPYLPEPYNNASVAAGIYTGGYMFPVPASQSWLENARQYHNEYETGVTEGFLQSRRQYARDVFEMMKNPSLPGVPPSEIDISFVDAASLIKPSYITSHGQVQVLEVGVGVETLNRQMYCFVWEFRGSLELSVVYNEAFYEEAFVETVVNAIGRNLRRELEVSD